MKSLFEIPEGKEVLVAELSSHPEVCERLREMGFCENARVKCISNSGTMLICQVCNSRLGINESLAKQIFVLSLN
jgi:ferrous iron transport protein A